LSAPTGTESIGLTKPKGSQYSNSTTLSSLPPVTAVSSVTTDLLEGSDRRQNGNTSVVNRAASPQLYRLLPTSSHRQRHNHLDNSVLTIPSLLSFSSSNLEMNSSFSEYSSPSSSSMSSNLRINPHNLIQSSNRSELPNNFILPVPGFSSQQPQSQLQQQQQENQQGLQQHQEPISSNDQLASLVSLRSRSRSRDDESFSLNSRPLSPVMKREGRLPTERIEKTKQTTASVAARSKNKKTDKSQELAKRAIFNELSKNARKENDSMVYLDGPRIYTCGECRTHLTSHDEIISKSFHGRHGRAYLFDQCVNMTIGPPEDRRLMTGLHSVNDIFCKRCKTLIGWTYSKAYEQSQKYKEGKFIIEKIHLHMEESDCYEVNHPAGERRDRWRIRSMSWSSENSLNRSPRPRLDDNIVYEYRARTASWATSPSYRSRSISMGGVSSIGSPSLSPFPRPPTPPAL